MKNLFILLFGLLPLMCICQSAEHFTLHHGNDQLQPINSCHLDNGLYAVFLQINNDSDYTQKNVLVCFNEDNHIVWQKEIKTSAIDSLNYSYNLFMAGNGTDIVLGWRNLTGDFTLCKINSSGNEVWSKKISPDPTHVITDIQFNLQDNSIYLTFTLVLSGSDQYHAIYKINGSGNLVWGSTLSYGLQKNPIYDLSVLSDGSMIGSGKVNNDMLIFCINPDGSKRWLKTFIEYDNTYIRLMKIAPLSNSQKFIGTGTRYEESTMESYYVYTIIDADGNIESLYKIDPAYGSPYDIISDGTNTFLVTVMANVIHIHTLNSLGEITHTISKQGSNVLYPNPTLSNAAGTFAFCTFDQSWNYNQCEIIRDSPALNTCAGFMETFPTFIDLDYYQGSTTDLSVFGIASLNPTTTSIIVQPFDLTKQSICISEAGIENNHDIEINVYPNPCTHFLTIEADLKIEGAEIYSADGKLILSQNFQSYLPSIDVSPYASGFYTIQVRTEAGITFETFIKQ